MTADVTVTRTDISASHGPVIPGGSMNSHRRRHCWALGIVLQRHFRSSRIVQRSSVTGLKLQHNFDDHHMMMIRAAVGAPAPGRRERTGAGA